MKRLFTSFPDGWPGIGLCLLRFSLAPELVGQVLQRLLASGSGPAILNRTDFLELLVGAFLVLGLLTPLAAFAGGIFTLVALPLPASNYSLYRDCEIIHVFAFAASIALVGPGAYSIDARIFGRREIIVPRILPSGRHR